MTAPTRISAEAPTLLRLTPAFLNLDAAWLYEMILRRGEGALTESGARVVETAPRTGRSPADKFIVCDSRTRDEVWWENNQPMSPAAFERLSADFEPDIHAASKRFGVVTENVVLDPETRRVDFDDESKTENTRIAYPLDVIPGAARSGRSGHPKNVVMLTCDAFGAPPPNSKLDASQAIYHFLSGYTARASSSARLSRNASAISKWKGGKPPTWLPIRAPFTKTCAI